MKSTYSSQLHVLGDAVLPGKAEDVRQIEGEIDDATAGGCQVGFVEEYTHKKTLHDGGDSEGQQEEEDKEGVAVIQHFSTLSHTHKRKNKDIYYTTISDFHLQTDWKRYRVTQGMLENKK